MGSLGRLAHVATDGFILSYIYAPLSEGPEMQIERSITDQPYTYLASGSQSFVFISQDGNYILKFFRENRWKPRYFGKNASRLEGRAATYASVKEAFAHLRDESALIALHLTKTSELGTVIIHDKNHIAHTIDLNTVAFAVQKRAMNLGEYLETASYEKGKAVIDEVLALMKRRFAHGLRDKDPHPINNFGVIDERVVDIDIGGFARDPSKGETYFYFEELEITRKKLLPWIKRHTPLLESHANQAITTLQHNH
ncbi:MAG: hypothetical protein P0S94_02800, partial [Simkaniaceae bacterium]|nr:hypothetical protein [Simkaniaceae bacterium]